MLKKVSSRVRAISSKTSVTEISITGFPGGLGEGIISKKTPSTHGVFYFILRMISSYLASIIALVAVF